MNTLSIIKDIIISAVIAVLTSGLFEVSNIIYQSIITVLILIIIFLILRGIDKKAKRMEILSILYVEQFLVPFMNAVTNLDNIEGNRTFSKVKVFIILPVQLDDIWNIKKNIKDLDRFDISNPNNPIRSFYAGGKVIGHDQLSIFDTPMTWLAGLQHLNKIKAMSDKKLSELLFKMNSDIKLYIKKNHKDNEAFKDLNFISFTDFKNHYK